MAIRLDESRRNPSQVFKRQSRSRCRSQILNDWKNTLPDAYFQGRSKDDVGTIGKRATDGAAVRILSDQSNTFATGDFGNCRVQNLSALREWNGRERRRL